MSICPECDEELIPRRGFIKIWHWSHRPQRDKDCYYRHYPESFWHIACKLAYFDFDGWKIEHRIKLPNQQKIRVDACKYTRVKEFVHTLTPEYYEKNRILKRNGYDVMWLFDGDTFVSARKEETYAGNGYKHFLKPNALDFCMKLDGLVYYDGIIYKHWQENVFYPQENLLRYIAKHIKGKISGLIENINLNNDNLASNQLHP